MNVPVNVPNWLLGRFDSLYLHPPHYEASYYGPINMLMTTFFPSARHFLVKPQARLRDPPTPGGRSSNDSYGQTVGISDRDGNPDFLVCKGSSALDADVPFLIYEIKRHEDDDVASSVQMERYMDWARRYQNQVAQGQRIGVYAVLVIGAKSVVYHLAPDAPFINSGPYQDTTGHQVFDTLHVLRVLYSV